MFRRVLVANRGEVALRVLRTLREMGIRGVVALSSLDLAAPPPLAERVICVGPGDPERSYMDAHRLLTAAVACGAEAVHPGYGFLSEEPLFSRSCREMGITFIGPSPETLRLLGDKEAACRLAGELGIPTLLLGRLAAEDEARLAARSFECPVVIKPVQGGGGRGIRLVRDPADLPRLFREAMAETPARNRGAGLYVERFLPEARHLEVQVMRDCRGGIAVFPARDCSLQYRNQKWVEETPAACCPSSRVESMARDAGKLAEAAGLVGVATVEFLISEDGYFFLEANPRLQVEHTVTEMVTGMDLVREQIRLAAGESLAETLPSRGHAVEARVYGLAREARPRLTLPGGPGIRVDSAPHTPQALARYDPLLAKICAWAPDRPSAIARLRRALEETEAEGYVTNIYHLNLLFVSDPFQSGDYHIQTLAEVTGGESWITCGE